MHCSIFCIIVTPCCESSSHSVCFVPTLPIVFYWQYGWEKAETKPYQPNSKQVPPETKDVGCPVYRSSGSRHVSGGYWRLKRLRSTFFCSFFIPLPYNFLFLCSCQLRTGSFHFHITFTFSKPLISSTIFQYSLDNMFSKSCLVSVLVLALSAQVHAHAAIAPALGVAGTPVRGDVQRPSKAAPCGTVNVAQTLDTSTPVAAAADGTFTSTITNFNAYENLFSRYLYHSYPVFLASGKDGSTQVTAQVDATAAGNSFVAATVSKNGVLVRVLFFSKYSFRDHILTDT